MTTTRFQQSDYKSNVDQTDGHLHVSSGNSELKVKEQSLNQFKTVELLADILWQLKKQNEYLSIIVGDKIKDGEQI